MRQLDECSEITHNTTIRYYCYCYTIILRPNTANTESSEEHYIRMQIPTDAGVSRMLPNNRIQ